MSSKQHLQLEKDKDDAQKDNRRLLAMFSQQEEKIKKLQNSHLTMGGGG